MNSASAPQLQLQAFDSAPRVTPMRRRAMILIALGEFVDGYDLISIAGALLILHTKFALTPSMTGLLGAAAFFGAAAGLLVAGAAADRIGRRVVFVHIFWLFAALSLISAFVTDYTQLLVVRVLLGIAIGADIATSMTFLGEISPRRSRGGWTGAVPQIAWTFGALSSLAVALALYATLGDEAWRWIFGLGAIPPVIILLGRRTLPESPRWLIAQGRNAEAAAAMRAFGVDAPDVPPVAAAAAPTGSYLDIFRAPYTRQASLAIIIVGLTPLCGAPASVVGPYVLRYVGLMGPTAALKGGMLIWVGGLIGSILAFLTIDRIGRLVSSAISLWGCAICMGVLVLSIDKPVLFVAVYTIYGVLIWFGASSFWALPTELLPTNLRARAQGIGNGLARTMVGLTTWIVPTGIAAIGFAGTFLALGFCAVLLGAFALTGLRFEPKGRDLDELSRPAAVSPALE
ncbi:MAG: MFS transporter [Alphaproteobacteria bacterium]|nr:MFS transporter [Alphaproteobacteria bacterium]